MIAADLRWREKRKLVMSLYEHAEVLAESLADLSKPALCPEFNILVTGGPVKMRYYRLAPDDSKEMYS